MKTLTPTTQKPQYTLQTPSRVPVVYKYQSSFPLTEALRGATLPVLFVPVIGHDKTGKTTTVAALKEGLEYLGFHVVVSSIKRPLQAAVRGLAGLPEDLDMDLQDVKTRRVGRQTVRDMLYIMGTVAEENLGRAFLAETAVREVLKGPFEVSPDCGGIVVLSDDVRLPEQFDAFKGPGGDSVGIDLIPPPNMTRPEQILRSVMWENVQETRGKCALHFQALEYPPHLLVGFIINSLGQGGWIKPVTATD